MQAIRFFMSSNLTVQGLKVKNGPNFIYSLMVVNTLILMSQKPGENTHNTLFDKQKLNYWFLGSNLESMRGFQNPQWDKLESTREKFERNSAILLIII